MRYAAIFAVLCAAMLSLPAEDAKAANFFQCLSLRWEYVKTEQSLDELKERNPALAAMVDNMIRRANEAPEAKRADVQAGNLVGLLFQCGLIHGYDKCYQYITIHDELAAKYNAEFMRAKNAGC